MSERNLYRRPGSEIWYARVQINGRDERRSLRTSSKVIARKKLARLMANLEEERFTGEERISWKRAVIEWATSAAAAVKPRVLERYKLSLRQLRPILDPLFVDEVSTKTIAKIVKERRDAGVTNATIKRDLTAVSSVLSYCCAQAWREDNPAKAYDRAVIRERREPRRLPAAEDIDIVVSMAPQAFGWLIRVAQYTGMRKGEITSLERAQVRTKGRVIDLWKTKTSRPRAVPIDDRAAGTLSGTVAHITEPWVFWHHEGEPYAAVSNQFQNLVDRVIAADKIKKTFCFHDLRHWFAVDYLRRGGNIYDLQQILGHSSIKTTERYLDYLTPDEQKVAKFGPAQTRHSSSDMAQEPEKKETAKA